MSIPEAPMSPAKLKYQKGIQDSKKGIQRLSGFVVGLWLVCACRIPGGFNFTITNGLCTHFKIAKIDTETRMSGLSITAPLANCSGCEWM
jgi:hypothetical protein